MKSLFIVPSCINFSPEIPLDYTPVRSLFSPEERFQQSLETINSIRKFSPTSEILFVEISNLIPEHSEILIKRCEHVIFPNESSLPIFEYFKDHPNKSLGVAFLLLQALYSLKALQYPAYNLFFQLSGRYKLNSNFNIKNHIDKLFVAKKHKEFDSDNALYTTLFSFSKDFFDTFYLNMLWSSCITTNYLPPYAGYSLETNILPFHQQHVTFVDPLGVEGNLGPDGTLEIS